MYPSESRDLAVSALIYMAAIGFGLAVVGVPVYMATRPTVVANPSARILERTADHALARHEKHKLFPVAKLSNKPIVSPAIVADMNAKVEAKADSRTEHVEENSARRHYRAQRQERARRADQRPSYAEHRRPTYPNFTKVF